MGGGSVTSGGVMVDSDQSEDAESSPGGLSAPIGDRQWNEPAVVALGIALAAALWSWSLSHFDLAGAGALGIVGVTPWTYFAALAVLAALFAWQLTRPALSGTALAAVVSALVVALFGVPNLIDRTGTWPTGYVHVGFIQYISENGAVPANVDARFSWPGFFSASAYLVDLAGLPDARPLLALAPTVFELLALPAVLLIAKRALAEREAWLAVVLFYCGLWFGQDYFAPQAAGYLLYLSILAVLFWTIGVDRPTPLPRTWVQLRALGHVRPPDPPELTEAGALAVQLVLVVLTVALVMTHQLTPISLVFDLLVLTGLGLTRYRMLWLSTLLIFVAWFSYGASAFWVGHIQGLLGGVGDVSSSVGKGLTQRVTGDPAYLRLQHLRIAWSLLYLVLAAIGAGLLLWRRRQLGLALAGLALAPFAVIAVQSYGGEVILRCFLYAMPFLAVLSAAALGFVLRARPAVAGTGVGAVVLVAAIALLTVRGANVSFERVSAGDVSAAEYVTATLPPGGSVALVEPFSPLRYRNILTQRVLSLPAGCETRLTVCVAQLKPDQVYLSAAQQNYGVLHFSLPPGWLLSQGVSQLTADGSYRIAFQRAGDVVLARNR
jgi:hypothetical protein